MQIDLPENARYIISKLNCAGYEAYAVGGAVRDKIMGREADDFDITTSALPAETKRVFSDMPVLETGIKHGTVTVLIDHKPYEVTTYRSESGYTDSRHPDLVTFVSELRHDLARRDFTMNAIAYSPSGEIHDPFGGINDISNGLIRTVGDPYERFGEDALRILRALRFSSVLGFTIEKNTSNAVLSLADTLKKVSGERIYTELKKLLCGINAQKVINEYIEVFRAILPVNGDHTSVSKLPLDCKLRMYCLFGKSYADALSILRADNETKHVCAVLSASTPIPTDITELKFYLSALGKDNAGNVIAYRRAVFNEDPENLASDMLDSGVCLFLSDLAVNGIDLFQLGIKGKAIGETLQSLLCSVLSGETENKKSPLLAKAKFVSESQ